MSRVRLDAVSKTFRRGDSIVEALCGVSLEVADGELVAILGPSGCGKTTLLRLVAGLEHPSSGSIRFDERDVTRMKAERRNVGFVFQSAALYPHLSIFDNIAFGPRARGKRGPAVEATVATASRRMRVDEHLFVHRPRQLSGGQQQRVALARALAVEPEVLLLDEPLAALDAPLRAELRVELARLHDATNATTLFVTHDQSEALALGHRVAVMNAGRLEQVGAPRELYEAPANTFVAAFVGTPPMAFVPASVFPKGAGRDAVTAGVRARDVSLGGEDLRGSVRAIEDLGEDVLAYVDGAFGTLAAWCGRGVVPRIGDEVGLAIDSSRVHFFDAAGLRI